jgi:hypothetical protein
VLCASVISEWLGGSPDVPTKQALRAERTCAHDYERPSKREARRRAAAVTAEIAAPDAMRNDRERATRALAEFLYDGGRSAGDKSEQLWAELTAVPAARRAHAARRAARDANWHEAKRLGGQDQKKPATPILDLFEGVGNTRPALVLVASRLEALYRVDDWNEQDLERARRLWQSNGRATKGEDWLELLAYLVRPEAASHRTAGFARRRRLRGQASPPSRRASS